MQIVRSMYPLMSETWITKHHNDTFATWLQKEVMDNNEIHEQLAWLARGPPNSILMYQGYEINGYTFRFCLEHTVKAEIVSNTS